MLPAGDQVVVAAVDGPQAVGQQRAADQIGQVGTIGMGLGDLDLLENELEVMPHEVDHQIAPFLVTNINSRFSSKYLEHPVMLSAQRTTPLAAGTA